MNFARLPALSKLTKIITQTSVRKRFFSSSEPPQKNKIINNIILHPFQSYFRMGGFTFGVCFVSNMFNCLHNQDRRTLLTDYPDIVTFGILTKSLTFGALWPSFYIKAWLNPQEVFHFGGSISSRLTADEKETLRQTYQHIQQDNHIKFNKIKEQINDRIKEDQ